MAARWTYGAEGQKYPVQPGERWRCGPHTFICGSVFDPHQPVSAAGVVYSDPPWNQGNLASFRTKAGLSRPDHTWLDVYARIVALAGGRPCFIEGGEREAGQVQAVVAAGLEPGQVCRRWPVTYYGRHPAVLHYGGPDVELDPSGLDDDDTPLYVLGRFPRGTVADPCAGRGLTSRAAEQAGWVSVNVELHPARMSAALARMNRLAGYKPELAAPSPDRRR
jgi:hypothetical protein